MSRRCDLTGQGPVVGHNVSHAHNISLRRWNVNLQKVRVVINGKVVRLKVSTSAIKSGLIVKPATVAKRRPVKEIRKSSTITARGIISDEAPATGFFSDSSVVSRVFKPKPKPVEPEPIPGVDIPDFDAPGPVFEELDGAPVRKSKKRF
jgi:large subunit ribosomal protein L28